MDSEYLMRMEDLLDLYEQPYDPLRPVVCYDEMPFQLLGEVLVPIPMKPGKTWRYDHHYKREGTCCILLAVEPLAGWRFAQVRKRRTKVDYAEFMQDMIAARYEKVHRGRLVEDNLNTHSAGSFYTSLRAGGRPRSQGSLRTASYAEEGQLAQHGRIGVVRPGQTVL